MRLVYLFVHNVGIYLIEGLPCMVAYKLAVGGQNGSVSNLCLLFRCWLCLSCKLNSSVLAAAGKNGPGSNLCLAFAINFFVCGSIGCMLAGHMHTALAVARHRGYHLGSHLDQRPRLHQSLRLPWALRLCTLAAHRRRSLEPLEQRMQWSLGQHIALGQRMQW